VNGPPNDSADTVVKAFALTGKPHSAEAMASASEPPVLLSPVRPKADEPRWPRTYLARIQRRGRPACNAGKRSDLWRPPRSLARPGARTCTRCGKLGFVYVLSNRTMLLYRLVRRRSWRDLRKACRHRFPSHLLGSQPPRRNARTCFEGPFGEVIRATGPMAKANPFRFSTKYQDDESDLLYYGHRNYNASTGRWLSRDPVVESGFALVVTGRQGGDLDDDAAVARLGEILVAEPNLYCFVLNNAVNATDFLGLCDSKGRPVNVVVQATASDTHYRNIPRVRDIAGVVLEMNKIKDCECVRRLAIAAHGSKYGFTLNSDGDRSTVGKYTDTDVRDSNATTIFTKLKSKVCFCKPCEIYLLSCEVGLGKVPKMIASATGCRVIATNGLCWPNPRNPPKSPIYEDLDMTVPSTWETFEP
jgi:RHS repeat-associated protein